MSDFLYNLLHPLPNAVMTVIMSILLVYWLFAFLSGMGLEDLDLGFDFDMDVAEADGAYPETDGNAEMTETEKEVETEKPPGFFMKFLNFLNVGKVPFMLILSTFKFFTWVVSLITTSFIDITSWGSWSILILIPLAFISIFLTKGATTPMVRFFREIGYKGEEMIDFLGRPAKMLSNIKDEKIGSAEVIIDKNPIKLNVISIDGEELKYGDYVIIADEAEDKRTYLVSKEISIRNI